LNSLEGFSKNTQISSFRKPVLWDPTCSMRVNGQIDGETDITKLIVAFLNFANAPKIRQLTVSFHTKTQRWVMGGDPHLLRERNQKTSFEIPRESHHVTRALLHFLSDIL